MNAPSMMIGQRAATFIRAALDQARAVPSIGGSHAEAPPASTPTLAGASRTVEPGEGERSPWPA
jgi:hypothetical protein